MILEPTNSIVAAESSMVYRIPPNSYFDKDSYEKRTTCHGFIGVHVQTQDSATAGSRRVGFMDFPGLFPPKSMNLDRSLGKDLMWRFPGRGVPQIIIHFRLGFSIINQPFWGTPMTMEPPMWEDQDPEAVLDSRNLGSDTGAGSPAPGSPASREKRRSSSSH